MNKIHAVYGTMFAALLSMTSGCSGDGTTTGDDSAGSSTEEGLKDSLIETFFLASQDHDKRAWPMTSCRQKNPSQIKTPFTISFYGSSGKQMPALMMVVDAGQTPWSNAVISDFDSQSSNLTKSGGLWEFNVSFTTTAVGKVTIAATGANAKMTLPGGDRPHLHDDVTLVVALAVLMGGPARRARMSAGKFPLDFVVEEFPRRRRSEQSSK